MTLDGSGRDLSGANLSPSDLANLSRYLTFRRYLPKNGGLFGSGWARFMADRSAAPSVATPADPQQSVQQAPLDFPAAGAEPVSNSGYQLAALSPGAWPIPVPGCANCHWPSQPPAPPPTAPPRPPVVDDPWTYYPEISRRNGGGWGTSPSNSGDDRKQCDIQERRDNAICNRQVSPIPEDTPRVRAVCHRSQADRYAHCLYTGEIRFPQLQTTKVQQGEPPIKRWRNPR